MMITTDLVMMKDGLPTFYKKVFDIGGKHHLVVLSELQSMIEVELLLRAVCELESEAEGV